MSSQYQRGGISSLAYTILFGKKSEEGTKISEVQVFFMSFLEFN